MSRYFQASFFSASPAFFTCVIFWTFRIGITFVVMKRFATSSTTLLNIKINIINHQNRHTLHFSHLRSLTQFKQVGKATDIQMLKLEDEIMIIKIGGEIKFLDKNTHLMTIHSRQFLKNYAKQNQGRCFWFASARN